jgi:hypothetical protein
MKVRREADAAVMEILPVVLELRRINRAGTLGHAGRPRGKMRDAA